MGKFIADIKKKIDSELVYDKKFLTTKIKSHGDEVTDFHDKGILKVDSNLPCLEVVSLDSALKRDYIYYLQVLLKYIEKKVIRHIIGNFSDSSSSDESDEE